MLRRFSLLSPRVRQPFYLISAASLIALACAQETDGVPPPSGSGSTGSGGSGSSGATSGNGGSGLTSSSGGTTSSGGKGGSGSSAFGGSAGVGGSAGSSGGSTSSGGSAGSSGGTSGGSGGSGGSSGSAGSGGSGGVPQSVIDAADVVVHIKNDHTTASASTLFFHFYIENKSDDPLPMANVKVRYWLDPDSLTPQLAHFHQATNIVGQSESFHSDGANSYVEMSFTGNSIAKGTSLDSTEFQLQITGGTYDQSNDWSFTSSGTRAPNDKVTLYLDGTLVWGCEPTGACFDDAGTGGGGGT